MSVGLDDNTLVFEFPEIHKDAVLDITFHRTNRLPEDAHTHSLPPSLGHFPLRDIHDLPKERLPAHWLKRGGVVMPMWQTEAMWMSFSSPNDYPMAVKVCVGKVNAVTGKPWTEDLAFGDDQDFMAVPGQPWMDGICVGKGVIRQFVAMPLGKGYTVEGQVTGEEEHGGVQIVVRPLLASFYEHAEARLRRTCYYSMAVPAAASSMLASSETRAQDMGLGAGGRMKQEIIRSKIGPEKWAQAKSRCFVAIANAENWGDLTGEKALPMPENYASHVSKGGAVFDLPETGDAIAGGDPLKIVETVKALGKKIGEVPIPLDVSVDPASVTATHLGNVLPITGAKAVSEGQM